jgi:hypothetical protein
VTESTAIENAASYNEAFYDELWARLPFIRADKLPWWPVLHELADAAPDRLELGPGVAPRLPIEGTHVCDLSKVSLDLLERRGGIAHHGLLQDDRFMGHVRRFEPDELRSKVERAGYALERFEVHQQSPLGPGAGMYVWFMRHAPRFSVWMLRYVFVPLLQWTKLHWCDDPSQWDARMKNATDCGAVFRRL